MRWEDVLYTQGFGSRRQCRALVLAGAVAAGDPPQAVTDPAAPVALAPGDVFWVHGQGWPYQPKAYLMLHKPAGTECSQRPSAWPSVYTLLPAPLRLRPTGGTPGVQAVGRLDQDTTGLLLLTDDGALIHRLASPRHHVPKVYEVTCVHPVDEALCARLRAGVVLRDDPQAVRPAAVQPLDAHRLCLTLTEGRYHQVKRMVAAAGNRVRQLHRSAFGPVRLPDDLPPGQWRWLYPDEVARLWAAAGRHDASAAVC
ncbi:16S rRNA pseudouridine(516) synthase [Tepidimonas charontis]|uniref:Pseudouridine synthase n=1 Tax=Tepidimonas charontis TaxID=2267262 RepID=A0A554XFT4_9BURK|nr:16S rRNA pseudouridine(516) synthase [Tepidimonas charontis]TSE34697.1 Ribosomal small subunit pseudouridine synthase A [Tepidimonas charontis]